MKTREQVEQLKENWLADSIWDIEETEGFEEYHDELLVFRLRMENQWKAEGRKIGAMSALEKAAHYAEHNTQLAQTYAAIAQAEYLKQIAEAINFYVAN